MRIWTCRKGNLFNRVFDRMQHKLSNWKAPLLPFAKMAWRIFKNLDG